MVQPCNRRDAGAEVTIHALWVELADRTGQGEEPDVRAAAAQAPRQLEAVPLSADFS